MIPGLPGKFFSASSLVAIPPPVGAAPALFPFAAVPPVVVVIAIVLPVPVGVFAVAPVVPTMVAVPIAVAIPERHAAGIDRDVNVGARRHRHTNRQRHAQEGESDNSDFNSAFHAVFSIAAVMPSKQKHFAPVPMGAGPPTRRKTKTLLAAPS